MPKSQPGELVINTRTVRIGNEVYPLANISRIQTFRAIPGGRAATSYPVPRIVVSSILGIAAAAAIPRIRYVRQFGVPASQQDAVKTAATVIVAVAAAAAVYYLVLLIYRLLFRKRRYALVIETAGTQYAALSGTDREEIEWVARVIIEAVENPPHQEVHYPISLDLRGAQGVQFGGESVQYNRYA